MRRRTAATLMMPSRESGDLFAQALARFQAGDLQRARHLLTSMLRAHPAHFDALHLLGVLSAMGGAHDEAISHYRKALSISGNHAELRLNLTLALAAVGNLDEALDNIDRALSLNRRSAAAHFTRGNILKELRRPNEALASYDEAIGIEPRYLKAWTNRGIALCDLARYQDALASHEEALAINPQAVEAWMNRGIALGRLRQYEAALASYDRALAIDSGSAETWSNRGNALSELKRHDEALASFDRALAINPGSAGFWSNRGNVLGELKRYDEALASFDKALDIDPEDPDSWYSRGLVFDELQRHVEALASFDKALSMDPHLEYCRGNWVVAKLMQCDWRGIEDAFKALREDVDAGARASNPFLFLAVPSTPSQQRRCAETYVRSNFGHAEALYDGERYSHDRIRLAYLSADFHDHATAYLMAGLIEAHDRTRFETTAISFGPDATGGMRERLSASFEHFIDVRMKSDREVALLLREAEIDVAIDLKGFTRDARPGIFVYRPAPVHVSYLGYPGTLGAGFMDYIVADRHVIPAEDRVHYSEKVIYLPGSYQVNDARRGIAADTPTRAECGLPEAGIVFCCFNNSYKITPRVFDVWMRLLRATPDSVLWLLETGATTANNLRLEANRRDVAPERLVFAPRVRLDRHLARHRQADLVLDTLPYNAHTTASDALWAGVPVLTCTGESFPGRVARSLLHAVGLPELATESLAEYEAMALALATDPPRLASLRNKLARNRSACPLFDTTLFTRHIETAYVRAIERRWSGLPPDHIYVEA